MEFFSSLPDRDQVFWRCIFTPRLDFQVPDLVEQHPQVEFQFYQLYVAMTRSTGRLVFIESKESRAGKAFWEWLHCQQLGEQLIMSPSATSVTTADEWRARGASFANAAEGLHAFANLATAVKCFTSAGDEDLKAAAESHAASLSFLQHVGNYDGQLTSEDEARGRARSFDPIMFASELTQPITASIRDSVRI